MAEIRDHGVNRCSHLLPLPLDLRPVLIAHGGLRRGMGPCILGDRPRSNEISRKRSRHHFMNITQSNRTADAASASPMTVNHERVSSVSDHKTSSSALPNVCRVLIATTSTVPKNTITNGASAMR